MKKIVKLQKWSNNIKHIISLIWWRVNTLHSTPIMCDSHTTIMNGVHKHIGYMSRKEWKKEMVTGRCYFPVIFDANCHSWFCDWMRRSTVVAVGVLRLVFDLHIFLYIALLCIFRVSCPSIPLLRGLIIPAFQRGRSHVETWMDPAPEGSSGSDQETVWLGPPAQKERLPHGSLCTV